MKQKEYETPSICVVHNTNSESLLAISGGTSDYEGNNDEWEDTNGSAKEGFVFDSQWRNDEISFK